MITLLNHDSQNWSKYNVLFEKAWGDLLHPNKNDLSKTLLKPLDKAAADKGKTKFADLAHYMAYIKELTSISPLYLMLPIDEAPFEINANTREIKVPPEFEKCSGVQNDNYAEIITFTIARYFDYKDLSEAQIAVQWRNETTKIEGVSFIQLIDLETFGSEGLIRFGWPITSEMTSEPGDLTFAVRFYTSNTDENGNIVFNYLLNTVSKSVPIKKTLNIDFNDPKIIKKANDLGLFTSYITNSMNPSYGIPTQVSFIKNLPNTDNIKSDNTLKLTVQCNTKDGNPITYEWFYEEIGFKEYTPAEWPTERPLFALWEKTADDEEPYRRYTGAWSSIKEELPILYIENPVSSIPVNNELYQIISDYEVYAPKNSAGEDAWPSEREAFTFWEQTAPGAYSVYYGPWPVYVATDEEKEQLPEGTITTKDITLYVLKSSLFFKDNRTEAGKHITGYYYVKGVNSNGENVSEEYSNKCKIAAPDDLKITTDLPLTQFFEDENGNKLTLTVNEDFGLPVRTYTLQKEQKVGDELEFVSVDNGTVESQENIIEYYVDSYGKYKIIVNSELNRSTDSTESNVCTISGYPIKPVAKALSATKVGADPITAGPKSTSLICDGNIGEIIELSIDLYDTGESYDEDIKDANGNVTGTKEISFTEFNNYEKEYKWFVQTQDSTSYIPLTDLIKDMDFNNDILVNNVIDSSKVSIRVAAPAGGTETTVYSYKCTVTNTCGERSESQDFFFAIT